MAQLKCGVERKEIKIWSQGRPWLCKKNGICCIFLFIYLFIYFTWSGNAKANPKFYFTFLEMVRQSNNKRNSSVQFHFISWFGGTKGGTSEIIPDSSITTPPALTGQTRRLKWSNTEAWAVLNQPCLTVDWTCLVQPKDLPAGDHFWCTVPGNKFSLQFTWK
jgi:hypothetical protein